MQRKVHLFLVVGVENRYLVDDSRSRHSQLYRDRLTRPELRSSAQVHVAEPELSVGSGGHVWGADRRSGNAFLSRLVSSAGKSKQATCSILETVGSSR